MSFSSRNLGQAASIITRNLAKKGGGSMVKGVVREKSASFSAGILKGAAKEAAKSNAKVATAILTTTIVFAGVVYIANKLSKK